MHAVALAARFLSDCFSSVETQIGSRYAIWESRAKAATIVYTVLVIGLHSLYRSETGGSAKQSFLSAGSFPCICSHVGRVNCIANLFANENIPPCQEGPLQLIFISPRAEDVCQYLPDNTAATHRNKALRSTAGRVAMKREKT